MPEMTTHGVLVAGCGIRIGHLFRAVRLSHIKSPILSGFCQRLGASYGLENEFRPPEPRMQMSRK